MPFTQEENTKEPAKFIPIGGTTELEGKTYIVKKAQRSMDCDSCALHHKPCWQYECLSEGRSDNEDVFFEEIASNK